MLSAKIKKMAEERGWWDDQFSQSYTDVLQSIGIDLRTPFADFYLHVEDGPTFYSRKEEIYQICWFILNTDYQKRLDMTHQSLKLPQEYIPLDGFEGEGGYFYNRQTQQVLFITIGDRLEAFQKGELKPQWPDFNAFLEWYFELEE
ncbi:hypothetical protein HZY88_02235 [Aerococcaceae bacterium DSM 111176]|nr:hypothetical protein [Aerococcaceae bacterium DSM 111176]